MPKGSRLKVVATKPDPNMGHLIGVLSDALNAAREGEYRSVCVVTMSADGASLSTQWATARGDGLELVGLLAALQSDILAERSLMETYSDLIEEVGNLLENASLAAHIPRMIQRAERRLERNLNLTGNEAMVRLDLVQGRAPLPNDYGSWRTVSSVQGWVLSYVTPDIFLAQYGRSYGITVPAQGDGYDDEAYPPDGGGRPGRFTIVGSVPLDDIEVSPEVWPYSLDNPFILASPAGGSRVTLIYRQGIPPLGPSNTTNWLLAKEPDLYLYGTLVEATAFVRDDARIPLWKSMLDEGMNDAMRLDRDARWGRARIVTTEQTP